MADTNTETFCSGIQGFASPRLFKALSDPNRLAILAWLAEARRPCTVSEIAQCCPVNISVVSRHLAKLREAGALVSVKRGKEVYYSVCCQALADNLRAIANALEVCCPGDTCEQPIR